MNLIEAYNASGYLENLTLIDCGEIAYKSMAGLDSVRQKSEQCLSVEDAVTKMQQRKKDAKDHFGLPNRCLDNIIITHRDSDHWAMLDALFCRFLERETYTAASGDCALAFAGAINSVFTASSFAVRQNTYSFRASGKYHAGDGGDYTVSQEVKISGISYREEITISGNDFECSICYTPMKEINVRIERYHFPHASSDMIRQDSKTDLGDSLFRKIDGLEERRNFPKTDVDAHSVMADMLSGCPEMRTVFIAVYGSLLTGLTADAIRKELERRAHLTNCVGAVYIGGAPSEETDAGNGTSARYMSLELELLAEHKFDLDESDARTVISLPYCSLNILEKLREQTARNYNWGNWEYNLAIHNNATSVVSLLTIHNQTKFLFTGDATAHTFLWMHNHTAGWETAAQGAAWTAPHHGSSHTITGKAAFAGVGEKDCFPVILSLTRPVGMIVSAACHSQFGHPGDFFYRTCRDILQDRTCPEHYILRNKADDAAHAQWVRKKITFPLYTTATYHADDQSNYYVSHRFTQEEGGTLYYYVGDVCARIHGSPDEEETDTPFPNAGDARNAPSAELFE